MTRWGEEEEKEGRGPHAACWHCPHSQGAEMRGDRSGARKAETEGHAETDERGGEGPQHDTSGQLSFAPCFHLCSDPHGDDIPERKGV